MSANNQQHVGIKEKIMSKIPGHNKDRDGDGIPDRLENNQSGHRTLSDRNGNGIPDSMERNSGYTGAAAVPMGQGSSMLPGTQATTTTTTYTKEMNGRPISGNILNDKVIQQETITTEPAMIQTRGIGGQQPILTDFNRDGIPDQYQQQQFVQTTTVNQTGFVDVREAPTMVQRVEKAAVVHEVIRTEEVVEVQPVIERERERLDVYEVVQPIREREVVATEVRTAVLPQQTRATVIADQSAFLAQRSAPGDISTREVAPTSHQTIQNAAIVHEVITHRVIEEVQPVIYKEIDRPVLIKETLPIYEKIVETPQIHSSVLPMRDLGTRTVTTSTTTVVGTDYNRNGIPDQLERGMGYQTTGLQSGLQSTGTFQQGYQSGLQGQQFQQGVPTATVTGTDFNRNGVPDQLEGRLQGQQYQQQGLGLQGQQFQQGLGQQGQFQQGLGQQVLGQQVLGQQGLQGQQYQQGLGLGQQGLQGQQYQQGQQGFGQQGFQQGGLNDRNGNGVPDNMERPHRSLHDLNGNGVPDSMEKGHGLRDLNGNGVDDTLERRMGNTSLNSNRL